jgi:hypothetical protein
MQEIGVHMHLPGMIILQGCECAEGDENIAKLFSQHAPGCVVYASPDPVSNMIPIIFPLQNSASFMICPFFRGQPWWKARVKAYRKKEEILSGYMKNHPLRTAFSFLTRAHPPNPPVFYPLRSSL